MDKNTIKIKGQNIPQKNTTVENHTLRVTLPTKTYEKIGRYGVFNDAMIILGSKSELKILKSEGINPEEIQDLAISTIISEHLSNYGRCSTSQTLMRAHGGHRMSAGMEADYCAAKAHAVAVMDSPDFQKYISSATKILEYSHNVDIKYRSGRADWHKNWKIEIIGDMPEQIGLCRM